jgi:hypothetical protein
VPAAVIACVFHRARGTASARTPQEAARVASLSACELEYEAVSKR